MFVLTIALTSSNRSMSELCIRSSLQDVLHNYRVVKREFVSQVVVIHWSIKAEVLESELSGEAVHRISIPL